MLTLDHEHFDSLLTQSIRKQWIDYTLHERAVHNHRSYPEKMIDINFFRRVDLKLSVEQKKARQEKPPIEAVFSKVKAIFSQNRRTTS